MFKSVSIFIRLRGISDGQWERVFSVLLSGVAKNRPQLSSNYLKKSVLIFIRLRGISDAQWERFLLVSQKNGSQISSNSLKE